MPLRQIALAVATVAAIALLIVSWLESRADRAQLQSVLAAQQQLIAAAESREQSNADALKSALAEIGSLKRQVQTPKQVVASLPQYLPLPQPITLAPDSHLRAPQPPAPRAKSATSEQGTAPEKGTTPTAASESPSSSAASAASSLPDSPTPRPNTADIVAALKSVISDMKSRRPPSTSSPNSPAMPGAPSPCPSAPPTGSAVIADADLKPLYDYVQDCRACQAQLAASNANLHDEQARSAALTRERDAAVTAAKGGSFWRRLKRNATWLSIGAAAGLVLSRTI
jgi:hypothetical protein